MNLPAPVKAGIMTSVEDLRKTGADVKWITEAHTHITLKFLGDTDEQLIPSLSEALVKKMSPYTPFYITISGLGCFPDKRRPRVLWVGVKDASGLIKVQKEIDDEMSGFGFLKDERDYSPHITVGRIRSQRGVTGLLKKLEEAGSVSFDGVLINGISLMKSELKPAGAEYTTLAEIPFGRRGDVQ